MNQLTASEPLFRRASPGRRMWRKFLEILLARMPTGRWLGRVPFFQAFYARQVLARRDHTGLHSGIYSSYAEALTAIPPSRLSGWDHEETSTLWVDQIDPVRPSTYPIFFWIKQICSEGSALVDLGGSIGLTYYGYRRFAKLPEGTTWTVVEVSKIALQGAKIAVREHAANLNFVERIAQVNCCDILLAAGALQYMETSVPGLIESLPNKPRHVLLNKLPVTPLEDCWTLHNYGPAITPQRLFNDRVLLGYFEARGYRLRDRWDVQDLDCLIPFYPQRFIRNFSGFYFELAA
jgi:putative methyltransferase (TIGR04325 family)